MWLATLNPGRKARPKRRKLSTWQQKVKKHGGVMQAVKAMRAEKRGRKARRGGRRRRNPFLTTTLTSGGAVVGMNAPRRKRRSRKIRSRRSAVARRTSRRARSRKAMRRSQMARKTRRRRHKTPSRGRGGRFKSSRRHSRRASRRRTRRNPVLPISWNPKPRRRRRSRRNPLFLSRKGFSGRKHSGYRRLHRRRHSPRYWHNPRKRRAHRRYRNNPVLPISWNPGGMLSGGPIGDILGRAKAFIDVRFWTETGLPSAVGFFGSKAAGGFIYNQLPVSLLQNIPAAAFPYVRMGADALGGSLLAYLVSRFIGKKQGDSVFVGTVVNVAYSALKALLGGTSIAATIGLDGLGDDLASRMKQEIANRVAGHLNGMGSYLRTTNLVPRGSMGEYVTESALRSSSAYSPGDRLGDSDMQDPGF